MSVEIHRLIDPVYFTETLLEYQGKPVQLFPFQKTLLTSIDWLHDLTAIQKGRAIGASFLCSIAITITAYLNSDARILIVSKTKEQAGYIFEHVERFFYGSQILRRAVNRDRSKIDELHLNNGSIIVHRTVGVRGDNLRGFHCQGRGAVFFDESAVMPSIGIENIYPAAVGCGIHHVSTPRQPSGEFWKCCHDERFRLYKFPSTVSPRITAQDIEFWKSRFSPSRYKNEVMAEFAAGEDAVFDPESIDRNIDDSLQIFNPAKNNAGWSNDKNYVMSLDISKVGCDRWVLTIGEIVEDEAGCEVLRVVAYHSWAGTIHENDGLNCTLTDNPNDIIRDVLWYAKRFWPLKVYCDATSNEFFCHVLKNKHNLPVEEKVWSTTEKQRLIEHLASCFRADKIRIPRDQDMIDELLAFSYDVVKMQDQSDKKLYLGSVDDHVASLAMLSLAISWDEDSAFCEFLEVA